MGDERTWDSLMVAYYPAKVLNDLLGEYGDLPFADV
jgi:hypothetical protein